MTFYGIVVSHEIFEFYQYLVGYSMVYHSKATDSASPATIVGLPKMFEK